MKSKSSNYCVYTHHKKDTGVVFYVGKGQPKRPFSKKRNIVWHRIASKHGFEVKIVKDNLTEAEAFSLETQLIKEYKNSGLFLANLTDGGDGSSGYKHKI